MKPRKSPTNIPGLSKRISISAFQHAALRAACQHAQAFGLRLSDSQHFSQVVSDRRHERRPYFPELCFVVRAKAELEREKLKC